MVGKHTQKGASTSIVLIMIVFALLAAWGLLKLGPVYLQHYSVVKILDKVQEEFKGKLARESFISTREIQISISKRIDVNYISILTKKNIDVDRTPKGFNVRIKYDVVVPFFGNIDALLHFDNSVAIEPDSTRVSTSEAATKPATEGTTTLRAMESLDKRSSPNPTA